MELRAGDFVTDAVRLLRPLAEGGMGRVWVAEHLGLHTQVVVKLMAQEMMAREDGAARFAREAAIAAAIKSPHVVQVFDHGVTKAPTIPGIPYIVMELLEGHDLSMVLEERGRLEPHEAAQVIVQIGKALAKAHKAGIVHRDIKPENIFLCSTEAEHDGSDDSAPIHVKLLDFGTAKESKASSATIPGEIMGTPYYMSPEQAIGATVDARTDMWSLGVVAFEMLTGTKPFDGASVGAIALAIHAGLPRVSSRVEDLPASLDDWFSKACAQLPHLRFATMREMTAAFVEALTGMAPGDTTEAIVLPRRISVRPSSPPGSEGRASSPDEMRKTLPTSIAPSMPPPAHPHPAFASSFAETASFGSAGLTSESAVEVPVPNDDVKPMLDSIAPLTATLQDRRQTGRGTKLAAGLVGAAAAAMMAAIVLHHPKAAEPAAAAAPPPPVVTHATPPPPPSPEPVIEPAPPPVVATPAEPPVVHKKGKKAAPAAPTTAPAAPTTAPAAPTTAPAAPTTAPAASTTTPAKKGAAKHEDEDLAKLIKAGTDTPPAPPASAKPKGEPAPAPTPLPPPAATPIPPKSDPPPTP